MDIIAVQTANKVKKTINTRYNGFSFSYVAKEGDKIITSPKEFDKKGNSLRVYVNGMRAVKDRDYTLPDNKTVSFNIELLKGDEIELSTEIAGIPEIHVDYDDTDIKASIAKNTSAVSATKQKTEENTAAITTINGLIETINSAIAAINTALDDDKDGTLTDTLANLKAQWDAADNDLKSLITNKATQADLDKAVEDLSNLSKSVSDLSKKVSDLSANGHDIIDATNGRKYSIVLNNGSISAALNQSVMALTATDATGFTKDIAKEFHIAITANDDAGTTAKEKYVVPENCTLEKETSEGVWIPITNEFVNKTTIADETINLRATFTAAGNYEIKCQFINDKDFVLGEVKAKINITEPQQTTES